MTEYVEVARILAFTVGHDVTQPATLDVVRAWRAGQAGHASVPIATGTASDLARIHLAMAPPPSADALCWAMDPQAHATDLQHFCGRYGMGYVRADAERPFEEIVLQAFRQGRFLE